MAPALARMAAVLWCAAAAAGAATTGDFLSYDLVWTEAVAAEYGEVQDVVVGGRGRFVALLTTTGVVYVKTGWVWANAREAGPTPTKYNTVIHRNTTLQTETRLMPKLIHMNLGKLPTRVAIADEGNVMAVACQGGWLYLYVLFEGYSPLLFKRVRVPAPVTYVGGHGMRMSWSGPVSGTFDVNAMSFSPSGSHLAVAYDWNVALYTIAYLTELTFLNYYFLPAVSSRDDGGGGYGVREVSGFSQIQVHPPDLTSFTDARDVTGGVPAWVTGVSLGADERDITVTTSDGLTHRMLLRRSVTIPNQRTQASCAVHQYREKLDYASFPRDTTVMQCRERCRGFARCTGFQIAPEGCVVWLGGVCSSLSSEGFVSGNRAATGAGLLESVLWYFNYTAPSQFGGVVERIDPCERGDNCMSTDALFRPHTAPSRVLAASASRPDDAVVTELPQGTAALQYTPSPIDNGVLYMYKMRPPFDVRDREASAKIDYVTAFAAGQRGDELMTAHATLAEGPSVYVTLSRIEDNDGRFEVKHVDAGTLPLGDSAVNREYNPAGRPRRRRGAVLSAAGPPRAARVLQDGAGNATDGTSTQVVTPTTTGGEITDAPAATPVPGPAYPPVPSVPAGANPYICRRARPCANGCVRGLEWEYDDVDRCGRLAEDPETLAALQEYYGTLARVYQCGLEDQRTPRLHEANPPGTRTVMPRDLVCLPYSRSLFRGEACVDLDTRVDSSSRCATSTRCVEDGSLVVATCEDQLAMGAGIFTPTETPEAIAAARVKMGGSGGMEAVGVYTKAMNSTPIVRLFARGNMIHPRTVDPPADPPCAHQSSSMVYATYDCTDGISCQGEGCCDAHAGNLRCPPETPNLCLDRARCEGDSFCCAKTCAASRDVACRGNRQEEYVIVPGDSSAKGEPCPVGYLPVTDFNVNGECWEAAKAVGASSGGYGSRGDPTLPGCYAAGTYGNFRMFYNTAGMHQNYPNSRIGAADGFLAVCKAVRFVTLGAPQTVYPTCADMKYTDVDAALWCRMAAEQATSADPAQSVPKRWMGTLRKSETVADEGCVAVPMDITNARDEITRGWGYYYVLSAADAVQGSDDSMSTEGDDDAQKPFNHDALAPHYPQRTHRVCVLLPGSLYTPTPYYPPRRTPAPPSSRSHLLRCPWYCVLTCAVVLVGGCITIALIFTRLRPAPVPPPPQPSAPAPSAELAARARRAYTKLLKSFHVDADPSITLDACSVCLDDLMEDVIELPACKHRLHLQCMTEYIACTFKNPKKLLKIRCPNCRAPVSLTEGWDKDSCYAESEANQSFNGAADLEATVLLEEAAAAMGSSGTRGDESEDDRPDPVPEESPVTASPAPAVGGGGSAMDSPVNPLRNRATSAMPAGALAAGGRQSRARTLRETITQSLRMGSPTMDDRARPSSLGRSFNSPLLGGGDHGSSSMDFGSYPGAAASSGGDRLDSGPLGLDEELVRMEEGGTTDVGFVRMAN